MGEFDHDRYLAGYRTSRVTVWCANKECENHTQGLHVRREEEYGQAWITPEECPICNSDLLDDEPEDEGD